MSAKRKALSATFMYRGVSRVDTMNVSEAQPAVLSSHVNMFAKNAGMARTKLDRSFGSVTSLSAPHKALSEALRTRHIYVKQTSAESS